MLDTAELEWLKTHPARLFAKMDCVLAACNGGADQLHLLVEHPPKSSVSALVNAFKGTSRRGLREARSDIATRYRDDVLWSAANSAAFTGGALLAKGKQYATQ